MAPIAHITSILPSLVAVGADVDLHGSFTDVGTLDTHSAQWIFSSVTIFEPIVNNAAVAESNGIGTATSVYQFDTPGVYHVMFRVSDDDLGQTTATTLDGLDALIVVYDPSGGFVTGGGWINSPAGAYVPIQP